MGIESSGVVEYVIFGINGSERIIFGTGDELFGVIPGLSVEGIERILNAERIEIEEWIEEVGEGGWELEG